MTVRREVLDLDLELDLDFACWLSLTVRREALDLDLDFASWLSFVVDGSS